MGIAGRENKLSKLVQDARSEGPQTINVRGKRAAVVLSAEDYDLLRPERPTLVDHLLSGPQWDDGLADVINARDKSPGREIDW